MANIHFGNIGDIWKHLPLAEILSIEKPRQYWESHAGSAHYPLTHSLGRDYGVFHFLEHVAESPVLRISAFARLLDKLRQKDGHLLIYPGSPFIAMHLLEPDTTRFLFCDTDVTSLDTIRDSARTLGILEMNVECIHADGVSALVERTSRPTDDDLRQTFVHIDPYEPLEESEARCSALDLFCSLSKRKAKTMLWYGYDSEATRQLCQQGIKNSLSLHQLDSAVLHLWCGEIFLSAMNDPEFMINPGVKGCGILCGNLESAGSAGVLNAGT